MSQKTDSASVADQTELVISQLDSLSILPSVAARFLSALFAAKHGLSDLSQIIESSPSLTARILCLFKSQGIKFAEENFSIRRALGKLPVESISDAFFSLKIASTGDRVTQAVPTKKQLSLHAIAVACCAEEISEIISPKMNSRLAFSAGLLHNIGQLAIEQSMPKSFAIIAKKAKSQNADICGLERQYLGLDYPLIGKRIAQKWHLPTPIALAIWLHRSDTDAISTTTPEARIASVVRLANIIASRCGIGQSGSFDLPQAPDLPAQSLGISAEQLKNIEDNLPAKVELKSNLLGLALPNPQALYNSLLQTTTAKFAAENSKLLRQNRLLHTVSSRFDFSMDLLSAIGEQKTPIEIAETFATLFQNFYQTGSVCLYLSTPCRQYPLPAVIVESQERSRTVFLKPPSDSAMIPPSIAEEFSIINAADNIDWLFEQLDVVFELSSTKIVPLLFQGTAIGAIVFEFRYPITTKQLEDNFKAAAELAAFIVQMAFDVHKQQTFAERFASLITTQKSDQPKAKIAPELTETLSEQSSVEEESLRALAELAGGAAHELNNPLSVVSGRIQLLSESESDPEKNKILSQINDNTKEISLIIDDLMGFAQPPAPKPADSNIKQILDEAVQLTQQKMNIDDIDIRLKIADPDKTVFVDSAQIVSSIANIFSNSLESYSPSTGMVNVSVTGIMPTDALQITITDLGCGMDADTLKKATHPFFSAKAAGRKRGMGLAYANRLIKLNKGSLAIQSKPSEGTTVTITLPFSIS